MSSDIPVIPGYEQPPAPRKTNWLLIGGILAALLIICSLLFCVALPSLLGVQGGNVTSSLFATSCHLYYPDLSTETCRTWADDVSTNHSDELVACSNQSRKANGQTDVETFFQCMDDKGLGPKSK